jgi:hypothetical protein
LNRFQVAADLFVKRLRKALEVDIHRVDERKQLLKRLFVDITVCDDDVSPSPARADTRGVSPRIS